jgi:hypothetical protein
VTSSSIREALLSLDAQTFWGPIKLNPGGWNEKFNMSMGQFNFTMAVADRDDDYIYWDLDQVSPQVVTNGTAIYPMYRPPCELTHTCPDPSGGDTSEFWTTPRLIAVICSGAAVLVLLAFCCGTRRGRQIVTGKRMKSELSRSLFSQTRLMPEVQVRPQHL